MNGKSKGQTLVGVIVVLTVAGLLGVAMIQYVQNQSKWSVKQKQTSNAFTLAEASVDRALNYITMSNANWQSIQNGNAQTGYAFDQLYNDVSGGTYAISITSGPAPATQQVTIIGIGRDAAKKEVRTIRAVYVNSLLYDVNIFAVKSASMTGSNVNVEWGSVVSQNSIDAGSKVHPSFWSAASIKVNGTTFGPTDPHCDQPNCWWWHSYDTSLPPTPTIDLNQYQSLAVSEDMATCGSPGCTCASPSCTSNPGCPASCATSHPCNIPYFNSSGISYSGCTDTTNKTFFVAGDWTGFNNAIAGNVIVTGNLSFSNGNQATLASYQAVVPPLAWKQYCNDWASYQAYDSNAVGQPACFNSLTNGYSAPTSVKYSISPSIHGFVYIGKDLTIPQGGGNSDLVHGAIFVQGNAKINTNSHGHIYYDPSVAQQIITTTINIQRQSWQEIVQPWTCPPLAPALCP